MIYMYRLAILYNNKMTIGKNFNTKEEAETFVLEESERSIIKRADLLNKETGERIKIF